MVFYPNKRGIYGLGQKNGYAGGSRRIKKITNPAREAKLHP
jgi:hypothetical protein